MCSTVLFDVMAQQKVDPLHSTSSSSRHPSCWRLELKPITFLCVLESGNDQQSECSMRSRFICSARQIRNGSSRNGKRGHIYLAPIRSFDLMPWGHGRDSVQHKRQYMHRRGSQEVGRSHTSPCLPPTIWKNPFHVVFLASFKMYTDLMQSRFDRARVSLLYSSSIHACRRRTM